MSKSFNESSWERTILVDYGTARRSALDELRSLGDIQDGTSVTRQVILDRSSEGAAPLLEEIEGEVPHSSGGYFYQQSARKQTASTIYLEFTFTWHKDQKLWDGDRMLVRPTTVEAADRVANAYFSPGVAQMLCNHRNAQRNSRDYCSLSIQISIPATSTNEMELGFTIYGDLLRGGSDNGFGYIPGIRLSRTYIQQGDTYLVTYTAYQEEYY